MDWMPMLPSALARLDHFANRIEGLRLQVSHQPVPGLDFYDCLQVLGGRMQLVGTSLIHVPTVRILILHRPKVLLKSVLEDFLGIEVHAPVASHGSPPLNAASRRLRQQ